MKKVKISTFIFTLVFLLSIPFTAFANETNDTLTDAINKKVKEEYKDYKNSLEIIDSITTSAEVTEDNSTETRNVQVVFAHAKKIEKRDRIFYLDVKEIYYYDLENNKLLESGAVQKNGPIDQFVKKHEEKLGKQLNAVTVAIFLTALLLGVIVLPILIMVFHNPSRSSLYKVDLEQVGTDIFRG